MRYTRRYLPFELLAQGCHDIAPGKEPSAPILASKSEALATHFIEEVGPVKRMDGRKQITAVDLQRRQYVMLHSMRLSASAAKSVEQLTPQLRWQ
jgi:hypothetical protein